MVMTTNNDCKLIPSAGVLRAYTSIAVGIAITDVKSRIEPANSWPECGTLLTHPRRPHLVHVTVGHGAVAGVGVVAAVPARQQVVREVVI